MSRTMAKPKKLRDERMEAAKDERVLEVAEAVIVEAHHIVPRIYAPPACSMCTALREPGSNYSRVYGTQRVDGVVVRYIRCHYCNNTFKHIDAM